MLDGKPDCGKPSNRACDCCGGNIPVSGGYGTGSLADGLYCSLDCLARVVYESGPRAPVQRPASRPEWN